MTVGGERGRGVDAGPHCRSSEGQLAERRRCRPATGASAPASRPAHASASWPSVTGVASIRWVRPDLTTVANRSASTRNSAIRASTAGWTSSTRSRATAMRMAAGTVSLEDCEALTWSLGWTAVPSAVGGQRRQHLVDVHVRRRPGPGLEHVDRELVVELAGLDASAAAAPIAAATAASSPGTSSSALTGAACRLINARAWATRTSSGRWAMGKLPIARSVCFPHSGSVGAMPSTLRTEPAGPGGPVERPTEAVTVVHFRRHGLPRSCPRRVLGRVRAVLFDLDGVLTPTADIHQRAWTTMFDDFLVPAGPAAVHGRRLPRLRRREATLRRRPLVPRLAGHHAARRRPRRAARRGVGRARSAIARTTCSRRSCATTASRPTRGRCGSSTSCSTQGTHVAVVSSSRNAKEVLDASGLAPRFEVVADGVVAAEHGIAGKPAPDMFLCGSRAARRRRLRRRRRRGRRLRRRRRQGRRLRARRRRRPRRRSRGTAGQRRRPSSSTTSPSSRRHERRREDRRPPTTSRSTASRSTRGGWSSRSTTAGDLGLTETLFAVGQRLPGHAGQPGGGPRRPQPRHVPQRVPRDVAHPPRRGGVRVRQDGPDDRQRARRQADEAVRRRRTAAAGRRRHRGLRAGARLP